jgi:hypothetical protein
MPGSKGITPYQNNEHGAGAPSMRVCWATVHTFGDDVDEVQSFTTVADQGQNLGGYFRLTYKGDVTSPIPYNARPSEVRCTALTVCGTLVHGSQRVCAVSARVSCAQVRNAIESHLPLAGKVHVTRSLPDHAVSTVAVLLLWPVALSVWHVTRHVDAVRLHVDGDVPHRRRRAAANGHRRRADGHRAPVLDEHDDECTRVVCTRARVILGRMCSAYV